VQHIILVFWKINIKKKLQQFNVLDFRQSIRETWGNRTMSAHIARVFFLVAGRWDDIQQEYDEYQDLLWIDEEEVYDGERSVLTHKTLSFVSVVHHFTTMNNGVNTASYLHCFKTDDDSYVNVDKLYSVLYKEKTIKRNPNYNEDEINYWGKCQTKIFPPDRSNGKWSISNKTYPETWFPPYCQGAGFALSAKFVNCAVGMNHIANMRFMPFEDVAVGILAERCGIRPTTAFHKLIRMYRTRTKEERKSVRLHLDKVSRHRIPGADINNRVLQHRIYDADDMKEHHLSALDPSFIPLKRREWNRRKAEREAREVQEALANQKSSLEIQAKKER